jgi:stage V sporulation protein G
MGRVHNPEPVISNAEEHSQAADGIEVVRLHRFDSEDSKVKAFVDIAVCDFIIKGLKVLQGKNGLFLGMPQEKAKDGKWYNAFYPKTEEARQNLNSVVMAAYQQ